MFLKGDERKECCLYCSKRELLNEFSLQAIAVVEKIAIDSESLLDDIADEIKDSRAVYFFRSEFYRKICFSMQRFPKMAAVMQMFLVVR